MNLLCGRSYEAFLIYNFLALCLSYVGGPGVVEVKMNGYVLMPSKFYLTCCLPPLAVNGHFVRRCQQGTLQFVLLMPLLGILSLVLYWTGNYTEGYWGPNDGCGGGALPGPCVRSGRRRCISAARLFSLRSLCHVQVRVDHNHLQHDVLVRALRPAAVLPWHP